MESENTRLDQSPDKQSQPVKRSRKNMIFAAVIILAVLIGVGLAVALRGDSKQTTKQSIGTGVPKGDKNPAKLDGPAVGNFAYVPACKVFTPVDQQDLFAGLAGTSLTQIDYADDGIAAADIGPTGVKSVCTREFGSDSAYAKVALTFTIDQFPTEAAAQKDFETYTLTQAELDKANKTFDSSLTVDEESLAGVQNTQYSPKTKSSHTLYGNKVISFSADFGTNPIAEASYKQSVVAAIPVVQKNIDSTPASYTPPSDSKVFDKKIGTATLYNPCKLFSGQVYRDASKHYDNPSRVELTYNYNSAELFPNDKSDGYAVAKCERFAYPGTNSGVQSMQLELEVFKTAAEAQASAKQNVTKRNDQSFYKMSAEQVKGVGSYAAYLKPDKGGNISYYYVQKGPYVLVLNGSTTGDDGKPSTAATDEQYRAFAELLAPKLK